MKTVYLDTETTGLKPADSRIVEVSLVDQDGVVMLNTLVDPQIAIPVSASAIHGITDEDVRGAPQLAELLPTLNAMVRGTRLVIYNKAYDIAFLPSLGLRAREVKCCMLKAQTAMGVDRWPKLSAAADWAGYEWTGKAHRSLADTLACRHVWNHIESLSVPARALEHDPAES